MPKKFIIPNLEEITEYIQEKGYNVNPKTFYEYFTVGDWIDSKGKKVRNWKQKIITWDGGGRSDTRTKSNKQKLLPLIGKTCGKRGCVMPAVYKSGSSGYDNYYCKDHMPMEVKKEYE